MYGWWKSAIFRSGNPLLLVLFVAFCKELKLAVDNLLFSDSSSIGKVWGIMTEL